MRRPVLLFVLAAATVTAACGQDNADGGALQVESSPASAIMVNPTAPTVGTNGTLLTDVQIPSYAAARAQDAFTKLNIARIGAGAGPVVQSASLDAAAGDHAAYLTLNGFNSAASVHNETPGLPNFTGSDPFTRMTEAGYLYSYATEVIGEIGSSSSTADCVGDLLDTVYHATLMLSHVTDAGIGFGWGATAGLCSISLATPLRSGGAQVPPSGAIVDYPYDGATVASGTFHIAHENPRASITLLPKDVAGTPVVVGFRNQDFVSAGTTTPVVSINQFTLSDARGATVPSVVLANSAIVGPNVNADIGLSAGFAVLVPSNPLPAGNYTVTLRAAITGGRPLALSSWSFTVAAP